MANPLRIPSDLRIKPPSCLSDTTKDSIRAAARPGALAYRLLQSDWSLGLAISRLDPWVTASIFHETTLRETNTG